MPEPTGNTTSRHLPQTKAIAEYARDSTNFAADDLGASEWQSRAHHPNGRINTSLCPAATAALQQIVEQQLGDHLGLSIEGLQEEELPAAFRGRYRPSVIFKCGAARCSFVICSDDPLLHALMLGHPAASTAPCRRNPGEGNDLMLCTGNPGRDVHGNVIGDCIGIALQAHVRRPQGRSRFLASAVRIAVPGNSGSAGWPPCMHVHAAESTDVCWQAPVERPWFKQQEFSKKHGLINVLYTNTALYVAPAKVIAARAATGELHHESGIYSSLQWSGPGPCCS